MNAPAEELTQRVQAARQARLNAQRMRQLAAERAEKLERELKQAAESGLKSEISRAVDARTRLRVAAAPISRKSTARISAIAAFGLLLGVAALGMGWTPSQEASAQRQAASPAPVLVAPPGDRLHLALSYSVSQPAAR